MVTKSHKPSSANFKTFVTRTIILNHWNRKAMLLDSLQNFTYKLQEDSEVRVTDQLAEPS